MDGVGTWSKDLQTLQAIMGQRYYILINVYTREELDMIDDWIEKIMNNNKVMGTLHEEIHQLKDQAQEKILEAERHYSDACLELFEDEERENLLPIEIVVENFKKIFEEASSDEDIH